MSSNHKAKDRFKHALNGIKYTFENAVTIYWLIIISIITIVVSSIIFFDHKWKILFVVLLCFLEIIFEVVNTAIERTVDAIEDKNQVKHYSKRAKDIAAGSVLLFGIFCVIMWVILYFV